MNLSDIVAVVSGGASGLGNAVVRRIVEEGGRVAILDLNEELGQAEAESLGEAAVFVATDVSNETAVDAFGGVQLAVNCAGILGAGRVLGRDGPMPRDVFAKVLEVNLIGSFLLARAAAARMVENEPNERGERGLIVNTASVAAFEGQIGQAAYSASKGGVVGMTLPLAREFARFGIRVMTIAPGIFMTPMMASLPEDIQKSLGAQVPFPSRLGEPEEFADLVAYIARNTMLNGETIRLDGGVRLQPK